MAAIALSGAGKNRIKAGVKFKFQGRGAEGPMGWPRVELLLVPVSSLFFD